MVSSLRFQLHFGPYSTPRFKYGTKVQDAMRGTVRVIGLSDAPIPWPVIARGSGNTLPLYGDLARAVRLESNQAVAHHWGVTGQTVTKWRKALSVAPTNKGTSHLRRLYARQEFFRAAQRKAWTKARDPERRAKIAAARRGKPRPPHVIAALRRANVGRSASSDTRRKMSDSHRRRGTRPPKAGRPWTPAEEALLRQLPAAKVAQKIGRSLKAVYMRRIALGMPDGRRRPAISSA
jgi:hypothetical protein